MPNKINVVFMLRAVCVFTLIGISAGCANFNTIERTNALPGSTTVKTTVIPASDGKPETTVTQVSNNQGLAIHLDAPQRLVYSNALGQLCAEPSPDALQAYAASLGASVTVPGKAADIAAALSASSSGIGLRTQAITLMRDHLYRLCEAYHNNAMTPAVVQMLQRSQDLTLGVLAIEQLTGVVVARQPMLTAEASATAARDMLNKRVESLEAAKKAEAGKKSALDDANAARDKVKASVSEDSDAEKVAKEKDKSAVQGISSLESQIKTGNSNAKTLEASATAAKVTQEKQKVKVDGTQKSLDEATAKKDQAEITRLSNQLAKEKTQLSADEAAYASAKSAYDKQKAEIDTLQSSLTKAKKDRDAIDAKGAAEKLDASKAALAKADAAVKAAELDLKDSQSITAVRRTQLENGAAAVDSATKTGGTFAPESDRNNIDKETVAAIADATKSIVEMVVNKPRFLESCMAILTDAAQGSDKLSKLVMDSCERAVKAYLDAYASANNKIKENNDSSQPQPKPSTGSATSPVIAPKPGVKQPTLVWQPMIQ